MLLMHHLVVHRQPRPQGEGQQQERQNLVPQTTAKTKQIKQKSPTILFCSASIKLLFTENYYITCTQLHLYNCTIESSIKIKLLWETRGLSYMEKAFLKRKKGWTLINVNQVLLLLSAAGKSLVWNKSRRLSIPYADSKHSWAASSGCAASDPSLLHQELPDCPEPRPGAGAAHGMENSRSSVGLSLGMPVGFLEKAVPGSTPRDLLPFQL